MLLLTLYRRVLLVMLGLGLAVPLWAATGLTNIAATKQHGVVTVFYPAAGENQPQLRDGLRFDALPDAKPIAGNGRLIVMSHGSGGSPWDYADLAGTLVSAGFVVAVPTHLGDNSYEHNKAGPASWKLRPKEISAGIDAIASDSRFAALKLDRIGMYGMSAGGHTGLSLAGGRWSPSQLLQHCQQNIRIDFNACAGTVFQLNGSWSDEPKIKLVQWVQSMMFDDPQFYQHRDPRITAIVVGVPYAADFDFASLAQPHVPLAVITARKDVWLHPQFHSDVLLQVCQTCEHLHDFKSGGHGALLSPIRPQLDGLLATLLADPAGFDRSETQRVNLTIRDYFLRQFIAK